MASRSFLLKQAFLYEVDDGNYDCMLCILENDILEWISSTIAMDIERLQGVLVT